MLTTVSGEEKVDAAATVRLWLLLVPKATSPFAVIGAVEANVVAAFTTRVLLPVLLPRTVLPRALN